MFTLVLYSRGVIFIGSSRYRHYTQCCLNSVESTGEQDLTWIHPEWGEGGPSDGGMIVAVARALLLQIM